MKAAKATTMNAAEAAPRLPAEFVQQLKRIFAREGAHAASAYFERYGSAMIPRLTSAQATRVEEIMHIVDTITGWQPPPDARALMVVPAEPVDDPAAERARAPADTTAP